MVTLRWPLGVSVSSIWANNRKSYPSLLSLPRTGGCLLFRAEMPNPKICKINEVQRQSRRLGRVPRHHQWPKGARATSLRLIRDWTEGRLSPGQVSSGAACAPVIPSLLFFFFFSSFLTTAFFIPSDTPSSPLTTETEMILRILVYSCSIVVLCTVANAFTPLITTGASSSFVEGKAMYISGGFNRPQRVVPQTFAIGKFQGCV